MRYLQAIADQLHDNCFEDQLNETLLGQLVSDVGRLIERLWQLRETGANPDFLPGPDQQRIISRLLIPEDVAQSDDGIDLPPSMPPFIPPFVPPTE